ncbi:MAG: hypothetical protein D6718_04965 [Acidobacteria bacterium]|nr:MAG: hypothetical protein D6718_04965 [Acidobacteriota bacterium]
MPSRRKTLLVVDPSVNRPEGEAVAWIAGAWGGPVRVCRPALEPGSAPPPGDPHEVGAVVVMGSAASVHDDRSWLAALGAWLAPIVRGEVEVPLLGICFGHQLLAHLAGGEVRPLRADRSKVLGVSRTRFEPCRLHPGGEMPVVVSHREVVTRVPEGFRVVARRREVPVDAIEHQDRPLFGVQFHPEAGPEFAEHVGIDPARLRPDVVAPARGVLMAFLSLAAEEERA